ncbi:MAG: hypothetical protein AAF502_03885 [Bacteroidota bacterium]
MATPIIFLAFANSETDPLPSLKTEDDGVYSTLARRAPQGHFALHRDSSVTIPKIAEYLVLFRDDLEVFMYSGHAERDGLFLEDDKANAQGIAQLLALCPKLKLVILNGCSTKGQVDELLKLETNPVVIATSAPVGDFAATQFSTTFFQSMSDQFSSIEEAFKAGIAAAQTKRDSTIDFQDHRGGFDLDEAMPKDQSLWGLYSKSETNLQWKLPMVPSYSSSQDYLPNVKLIMTLGEALSEHNTEVAGAWRSFESQWEYIEDIAEDDTRTSTFVNTKNSILKSLPHPISEQLRKLMVEQQVGSEHKFYDKLGSDRLKQLSRTYSTVIELFTYIFLSQLWEEISKGTVKEINAGTKTIIRDFFRLDVAGRVNFSFPDMISSVLDEFRANNIECFVDELNPLDSYPLKENKTFESAWQFMETLENKLFKLGRADMEKLEADQLCIMAEEKLGLILSSLSFLANYLMFSVQDIDAIKYRNDKNPKFQHKLIRFQQLFTELAIEKEIHASCMDTASILLINTKNQDKGFLSLSPFIIDENAFDDKSSLAKLRYFTRYEKPMDAFAYKHVYKPDDFPLVIQRQRQFRIVREQFNDFSTAIFNQPLQAL